MRAGSATSGLSLCEKGWEYEKQDLDCQGHFRSSNFFVGNELRIGCSGL